MSSKNSKNNQQAYSNIENNKFSNYFQQTNTNSRLKIYAKVKTLKKT
jgi:hypothetical protein